MTALHAWHALIEARDYAGLDDLLAEGAVFESPVVHTPQVGKAITAKYLASAMSLLNNGTFRYLGEWTAERSAVLEFACDLDGIAVNGVDMIWWDEADRITRFKVMVRPLKAINMLHQKMGEMLARG
ncbi:nuclear transport factor 2 family protein [Phenylobacterium aquaticum]|uniref:nuclear transport factor 2 family protein n=1 Tax=Phenylobacterium aquaticum TaxID=1763816 RepID=UPI0026EBF3D5|nr:nuclear transport factor 2 family protein [Phenylobacterium aquaticum]